jgi:uncharacterized protein (DUF305 family)
LSRRRRVVIGRLSLDLDGPAGNFRIMLSSRFPRVTAWAVRVLLFVAVAAGCRSAPQTAPAIVMAPGSGVVGASSTAAIAAAEKAALAYAAADVEFMQQMIPHHAQAVIMARWAPTHGARADVKVLCERIAVAQTDEIRMMRRWLGERRQEVPDSMSTRHVTRMGDMVHESLMPGMLTDDEMRALDQARGSAFDRLFLTGMIRHHQGAIAMVRELLKHGDAGHDETVFRFATDVEADQTAEVHKMLLMLETVPK